jgi:hypothetical protein
MIISYGGRAATTALYTPQNIDYESPEGTEFLRAVESAYPLAPDITEDQVKEFNSTLASWRGVSRRSKIRDLMRACEAIHPDLFPTTLRRTVHIALEDGFAFPAHTMWRDWTEQSTVDDHLLQEIVRYTIPEDPEELDTPREAVAFEEPEEKDGPNFRVKWYRKGFALNWETSRIADLDTFLQDRFQNAIAFLRKIEKFIYVTNMESNPSLQIDGSSVDLFSTGHDGGSNDASGGGVVAFSVSAFEDVVKLIGAVTLDGEPTDYIPARVWVKALSANHFEAARLFHPDQELAPVDGTDSFTSKIEIHKRLYQVTVEPVSVFTDADSWFVGTDYSQSPSTNFRIGFLDGNQNPDIVDIDQFDSTYYRRKKSNRWQADLVFGGTWKHVHGVYRGSKTA